MRLSYLYQIVPQFQEFTKRWNCFVSLTLPPPGRPPPRRWLIRGEGRESRTASAVLTVQVCSHKDLGWLVSMYLDMIIKRVVSSGRPNIGPCGTPQGDWLCITAVGLQHQRVGQLLFMCVVHHSLLSHELGTTTTIVWPRAYVTPRPFNASMPEWGEILLQEMGKYGIMGKQKGFCISLRILGLPPIYTHGSILCHAIHNFMYMSFCGPYNMLQSLRSASLCENCFYIGLPIHSYYTGNVCWIIRYVKKLRHIVSMW